ncbi:magnesium transporter MgtC [Lactococcus termiticola]|uniref:Magnesium transporter MgtC n=1 Tax=Lactococcus termiticola TaxID=2169526 RepID=A0A2R5HH41_9LACT|nr:magnesium transporter MgtC [Lactococcus termiticola]
MIVALAACLIMLVSKYGFLDLASQQVSFDPSRVAAQIVSGIGFLGAGMIFVRHNLVNGLTTAAGVWATAGIGMAIGGRLYLLGIFATLMILVFQSLLHRNMKWLPNQLQEQVFMSFDADFDALTFIEESLKAEEMVLINIKIKREFDQQKISLQLKAGGDQDFYQFIKRMNQEPSLRLLEY